MQKLKFTLGGNAKLSEDTAIFPLPSGWTCPGAKGCLAKADKDTGRLTDGPDQRHRCFMASQEAAFTNTRKMAWHNLDLLNKSKKAENIAQMISEALPPLYRWNYMRIHTGGDFYSQAYMDAWLLIAKTYDTKVFYAYTKSLPFWGENIGQVGLGYKPGHVSNFVLTASRDGKYDPLIEELGLRNAHVIHDDREAEPMGLKIDHTDEHAREHGPDFLLLLHGAQSPGSPASEATKDMRRRGVKYSYGKTVPV